MRQICFHTLRRRPSTSSLAAFCPAFIRGGALVLSALLLAGCTDTVSIDAALTEPPLIESLPLSVGVYHNSQIRSFESAEVEDVGDGTPYTVKFPLGAPSIALFDRVFTSLFEKVQLVEDRPPFPSFEGPPAAVIEPSISDFVWTFKLLPGEPFKLVPATFSATITYKFTLYSMQGDVLASWKTLGTGTRTAPYKYESFSGVRREVIRLALRDAAANFIRGFRDQPDVSRWLRNSGIAEVS